MEGGESRYSSSERKKPKMEVTHSKVTSYVSPRAQKNQAGFKFSGKNEGKSDGKKGTKPVNVKFEEGSETRDLYKEFLEKINGGKVVSFEVILGHFTMEQLHYDRNVFYQKYVLSAGKIAFRT